MVKCRPPNNRNPHPGEIDACNPYLSAQIDVLDPFIIVTLGKFGMSMFFPNEGSITKIHGKERYGTRRLYYPLYHPAYALRNPSAKVELVEDFARIPQLLTEVKEKRASGELNPEQSPELIEETSSLPPDDNDDSPKQIGLFD